MPQHLFALVPNHCIPSCHAMARPGCGGSLVGIRLPNNSGDVCRLMHFVKHSTDVAPTVGHHW